jgi:replicative DNA helicase
MTELAKIAPSAVDLEELIVGTLLLDKKAILSVASVLCVDAFYDPIYGMVYGSILSLYYEDKPIDIATVVHQLRKEKQLEKVGGAGFVSKLTNKVASTANLDYHVYLLNLKYQVRELIRTSNAALEKAYSEEDPKDIIAFIESEIDMITDGGSKDAKKLGDLLPKVDENIENRKKGISNSVTTGFKGLDELIRGWNKANYVVIGAKSSMGKTAFMCSSVVKAARKGIPQLVFELEMTEDEIMYRMVSQETGILYRIIANGEMNAQEQHLFNQKKTEISALPIWIDDTPGISIFELNAKCRRMTQKHGDMTVWIDYVQLVTLGQSLSKKMIGNREQEVAFISRIIKRTAKQIACPVIALAQLNNDDKKRASGNQRPILTDLRESSALQHDPDIVGFIHRPERTGQETDEEGVSLKGVAEAIIAKNRNGKCDIVAMRYTDYLMQFDDHISDDQYRIENFGHPDAFIQPSKNEEAAF